MSHDPSYKWIKPTPTKTKDITYLAGWSSRHGKTRKRDPTKGTFQWKMTKILGMITWGDVFYWLNQLAINYKGATVEARQRVTAILRTMWQFTRTSPFFSVSCPASTLLVVFAFSEPASKIPHQIPIDFPVMAYFPLGKYSSSPYTHWNEQDHCSDLTGTGFHHVQIKMNQYTWHVEINIRFRQTCKSRSEYKCQIAANVQTKLNRRSGSGLTRLPFREMMKTMQVRRADQALYRHELTVSSLGSVCQSCTAPCIS